MIRAPFGDESRRYFSSPQPKLPDPVVTPTADDPATKAATDKAQLLVKRQALAAKSQGATRLSTPTIGAPRSSTLLGGGAYATG